MTYADDDTRTPYNDCQAAAEADYWMDRAYRAECDRDDEREYLMRPTRSEADEDARTPIVEWEQP